MKWEEEIEEQIKERAEKYASAFESRGVAEASFIEGAEFGYTNALKRIEELEQENAELKKVNAETLSQLNLDNGELIIENEKLRKENERIKTKYYELQETLKNVRLALIKERTANIMNYGRGGVEMFDNMFEILKGVSN